MCLDPEGQGHSRPRRRTNASPDLWVASPLLSLPEFRNSDLTFWVAQQVAKPGVFGPPPHFLSSFFEYQVGLGLFRGIHFQEPQNP